MKLLSEKVLLSLLVLISIGGYITSCTHENMVLPPPATGTPDINRGNGVFLPGNLTPGDTSSWKFDQVHSSVLWSANYLGAAGLLTGRFNDFGISSISDAQKTKYPTTGQPLKDTSWAFYESDPTKTLFYRVRADEYFEYQGARQGRRMLFRLCWSTQTNSQYTKSD